MGKTSLNMTQLVKAKNYLSLAQEIIKKQIMNKSKKKSALGRGLSVLLNNSDLFG